MCTVSIIGVFDPKIIYPYFPYVLVGLCFSFCDVIGSYIWVLCFNRVKSKELKNASPCSCFFLNTLDFSNRMKVYLFF
uniref:Uncharacterized protein n=1 Tax=Aegilops tauschii subsp. strangulata TaxID=200361 RepID=A0A452YN95_AEGTS